MHQGPPLPFPSPPPTLEPTLTHSPSRTHAPNSSKRHTAAWFKIEPGSEWAPRLYLTFRLSRCCCQVQEALYEGKDGVSRWCFFRRFTRRGRQHFPQNMSSAISVQNNSATKMKKRFQRGERKFFAGLELSFSGVLMLFYGSIALWEVLCRQHVNLYTQTRKKYKKLSPTLLKY